MGTTLSNSDLIVAIVAGIIVLLLERAWTGFSEKIRERRVAEFTRSFLRDWHKGAMKFLDLEEAEKSNTLKEWNEYLLQLRKSPKSNSTSPSLPYRRTDLPDVASVITESLPNIPDGDIYRSLFMVNSKIQLLDERNRRFSEFFDEFLFAKATNEGRQKMAKIIIDALEFAKNVAVSAKSHASNDKLVMWLNSEKK